MFVSNQSLALFVSLASYTLDQEKYLVLFFFLAYPRDKRKTDFAALSVCSFTLSSPFFFITSYFLHAFCVFYGKGGENRPVGVYTALGGGSRIITTVLPLFH